MHLDQKALLFRLGAKDAYGQGIFAESTQGQGGYSMNILAVFLPMFEFFSHFIVHDHVHLSRSAEPVMAIVGGPQDHWDCPATCRSQNFVAFVYFLEYQGQGARNRTW